MFKAPCGCCLDFKKNKILSVCNRHHEAGKSNRSMIALNREITAANKAHFELMFLEQLRALKFFPPEREYIFHPNRNWRFDFAWPEFKRAVEIDGGVGTGGRHTRRAGYAEDLVKLNEALRLKWEVYRFTTWMVEDGTAIQYMKGIFHIL